MNKNILAGSVALLSMALSQLAAAALSETEAVNMARSLASDGKGDSEIVKSLVDDGRAVQDATAVAVKAAYSGSRRIATTKVGLCLAQDGDEAELVEWAALDAAGGESQATEIRHALADFDRVSACREIGVHILSPTMTAATTNSATNLELERPSSIGIWRSSTVPGAGGGSGAFDDIISVSE